jgi:GNAT superfamily N-acetyltransferase
MTMGVEYRFRNLDQSEVGVVKRVLFQALDWNPAQPIPVTADEAMAHPEVIRYHAGWGRPGDFGVVATLDAGVIGGAYCRLFTPEDHGAGYVDEATPELVIAVDIEHRGQGIGARILQGLEELASSSDFRQLSLSVQAENPAERLYQRCGYVTVNDDPGDFLMVKRL